MNALHLPIHQPDHLSLSQLRTLINCGWKWAYEHQANGERTIDVGGDARLRGQCLDSVATVHFRLKTLNGEGMPVKEMQELAVAEHEKYSDMTRFGIMEHRSKDRLAKQVALYRETFGATLNARTIKDVQKEITYNHEGLLLPIVGIIDMITDYPMIVDTKIKKKLPKQNVVDQDWQLTTYAMMTGIAAVALAVISDEDYPRAEFFVSHRTPQQVETLRLIYNSAALTIRSGGFLPAAEGHWLCNSQWCNHYSYCPNGASNETVTEEIPGMDE